MYFKSTLQNRSALPSIANDKTLTICAISQHVYTLSPLQHKLQEDCRIVLFATSATKLEWADGFNAEALSLGKLEGTLYADFINGCGGYSETTEVVWRSCLPK
jgi:hypothetical protein